MLIILTLRGLFYLGSLHLGAQAQMWKGWFWNFSIPGNT